MKNWKKFMFGALSAVVFASPSYAADDNSDVDFTLQLLHFSDVDGSVYDVFESMEYFGALVNAFKNEPKLGPKTLFVSSGDNIICLLYTSPSPRDDL